MAAEVGPHGGWPTHELHVHFEGFEERGRERSIAERATGSPQRADLLRQRCGRRQDEAARGRCARAVLWRNEVHDVHRERQQRAFWMCGVTSDRAPGTKAVDQTQLATMLRRKRLSIEAHGHGDEAKAHVAARQPAGVE